MAIKRSLLLGALLLWQIDAHAAVVISAIGSPLATFSLPGSAYAPFAQANATSNLGSTSSPVNAYGLYVGYTFPVNKHFGLLPEIGFNQFQPTSYSSSYYFNGANYPAATGNMQVSTYAFNYLALMYYRTDHFMLSFGPGVAQVHTHYTQSTMLNQGADGLQPDESQYQNDNSIDDFRFMLKAQADFFVFENLSVNVGYQWIDGNTASTTPTNTPSTLIPTRTTLNFNGTPQIQMWYAGLSYFF